MAEKPAGSSGARGGSRPPRDAFIARLVPDPKNLDANPPRVLHGYVGDSDEDGYSRIYCSHTLEAYADVRDEDILHYEASTDGCEHTLWARPDAQVKYGRRGAAKSEASAFVDGPLVQDYCGGGGTPQGPGPVITLHTMQHWCTTFCPTQPALCATMVCIPPTLDCPAQQQPGGFQLAAAGRPATQLGCPRTSTCPPTATPGCDPTAATMCFICPPITSGQPQCPTDPTAATMCFICPPITADCPVEAAGGAAARAAGPAAGAAVAQTSFALCNVTAATVCTQIGCPTRNPWHCQNTTATVCTQYGCPPHNTAATACTQVHCPGLATYSPGCTLGFTCTAIGCPQNTAATVCTQVHCPGAATFSPGCTLGFTCTAIGCR